MRVTGYSEKDVADGKRGPLGKFKCPYFQGYLYKHCATCIKWMYVNTKDANNQPARLYNCSDNFGVQFQMENNKFMFQLGAAQEETRNILTDATAKARKSNRFALKENNSTAVINGVEAKQIVSK